MPLTNTLTTDHAPMPDPVVADAEPEFADVEPAVPADPLAIAESAGHAVARHVAVARLPVGARGQELLAALHDLDDALGQLTGHAVEVTDLDTNPADLGLEALRNTDESDSFALTAVEEEEPTELELVPATPVEGSGRTASGTFPPALPEEPAAQPAAAPAQNSQFYAEETRRLDTIAQPGTGQTDTAEAFVQAGTRGRHQLAAAETIVLSGPDIKRKIRHKQSVMPSYISQVLYDDIGALFEIGDREGALISLERLLTIAPISPQIETFLAHNEGRLLEYYESVLGPWTRTARLRDDAAGMPGAYFSFDKMARVVSLLDGTRPLGRVLTESGLRQIEACAVLSQLARSNSLDLSQK